MNKKYIFEGKIKGSNTGEHCMDYAIGNIVEELETGKMFILDLAHFDKDTKLSEVLMEVISETITKFN